MRKEIRETIQYRKALPTSNTNLAIAFVRFFFLSSDVFDTTNQCRRVESTEKPQFFFVLFSENNGIITSDCVCTVCQCFLQCHFGGTAVPTATSASTATSSYNTSGHSFAIGWELVRRKFQFIVSGNFFMCSFFSLEFFSRWKSECNFLFVSFEAANGIRQQSSGFRKTVIVPRLLEDGTQTGEQEQREVLVQSGSWSYTGPDGVVYALSYIADENGFQPVAEHLPTPPPIPQQILESLQNQQQLQGEPSICTIRTEKNTLFYLTDDFVCFFIQPTASQ